MGVDQPRAHVMTLKVQRLPRLVLTEADDATVMDGEVCVVDLAGVDVDDAGVGEKQVRRSIAAGDLDDSPPRIGGKDLAHQPSG